VIHEGVSAINALRYDEQRHLLLFVLFVACMEHSLLTRLPQIKIFLHDFMARSGDFGKISAPVQKKSM
jgi:hypothetical protein